MKKVLLTIVAAAVAVAGAAMAKAEDIAALASPTADVITSVQSVNSVPSLEGTLQTADAGTTKVRQAPSKTPPGQRQRGKQPVAAPAKGQNPNNTNTSTEKRA